MPKKKKKHKCFICKKFLPIDQNDKSSPWATIKGPKGNKVKVCLSHPGVK